MLNALTVLAADEVAASSESDILMMKAIMAGIVLAAAAIALGWIGSAYMKAIGRNPEAGDKASQIVIIAAMVEVTALLAFLLGAFLLSA